MPGKLGQSSIIRREFGGEFPGNILESEYLYFETQPAGKVTENLAIVCVGYEKTAGDFEIDRQNYPYNFVKYTIGGRGKLIVDSVEYELSAGCVSGFSGGVAHHYMSDKREPMEHVFITFVGADARGMVKDSLLGSNVVVRADEPARVRGIAENILDSAREKSLYAQLICSYYLRILLLQICDVKSQQDDYHVSLGTFQRCKKYVDKYFSIIKSPGEVADANDVNVRYMAGLFKKYCQCSPYEYISRLKFNKAANLLLTSHSSIKEIADRVGFEDAYHFSRNFKKFHGISPSEYRARSFFDNR